MSRPGHVGGGQTSLPHCPNNPGEIPRTKQRAPNKNQKTKTTRTETGVLTVVRQAVSDIGRWSLVLVWPLVLAARRGGQVRDFRPPRYGLPDT